ncbi:MAG: glycoside hydrolase family 66 protein [Anaerocolumna sp.]
MIQKTLIKEPEIWTDKAQYLKGETVNLYFLPQENDESFPQLELFYLANTCLCRPEWKREVKNGIIHLIASIKNLEEGYYGVEVQWKTGYASTAFDITTDRSKDIRYGFLSDFTKEDTGEEDITFASKLHLNASQFYDWMYRHDKLVADVEHYTDPLGRDTRLSVIKEKVNACRQHGIRPFAYGAVYAATEEIFHKHPEWAVYTFDKQPMRFAEWLYYMNTSEDCPWSTYIVGQYANAVRILGFQGIHMDTYGFPKHVWNSEGESVALEKTFPSLIRNSYFSVTKIDKEAGVIFNAVNNWPVEAVADTLQDAVYIEVWPPHDTYFDLYGLIMKAKQLSNKPVVLAAYMKPFLHADTEELKEAAEAGLLITYSVINASGGRQLVFGENKGVLCDSYYAKYATMREEFLPVVQKYCDFALRYTPLFSTENTLDISMTATNGINEDIIFSAAEGIRFSSDGKADTVWTIVKESDNHLVIQLINLVGITDRWNEGKPIKPALVQNITISILLDQQVSGVFSAAPELNYGKAVKLNHYMEVRKNGRYWIVEVPDLNIWKTIWLEIN